MSRGFLLLLCLLAVPVGCGHSGPPAATRPADRIPEPDYRRVSTLLDFETDADALFVATDAGPVRFDADHARAGRSAVVPRSARAVTFKLPSLVSGRDFPGTWTLAGPYLYSPEPLDVSISVGATKRVLSVPANQWTPVLIDLAALKKSPTDAPLVITFAQPLPADIYCDDLLLIDNARTLVSPAEGLGSDGWSVRREGFNWVIDRPMRFRLTLPTEEAAGGWRVDESSRVRAIFRSTGETKILTLYQDGRSYWDGTFKPLSAIDASPAYEPQHVRPATIRIAEDLGRLDRNTPGDANHDGYNETTGSYQIVAGARHVELTLVPRTDVLFRPVLEFHHLPAGDVRVTAEGVLAPDVLRLPDGRVLVTLPVPIQRATTVDVRVR